MRKKKRGHRCPYSKTVKCYVTDQAMKETCSVGKEERKLTKPVLKGKCKHGEFLLYVGCPQCIEEERLSTTVEAAREVQAGNIDAVPALLKAVNLPLEPAAEKPKALILPELLPGKTREETEAIAREIIDSQAATTSPETALAKAPGADVVVMRYYYEAKRLQHYAESRVITTVEASQTATDDLSIIAKLKRSMEEKRKEYLAPLRAQCEAVNETYKALMAPIFAADETTRKKLITYQQEEERKRKKQEEINQKRLEAAQEEMNLKGELTESVQLVEVKPEVKNVRTNLGTAGMVANWKYEVVDFAQLPDEFKVADTAMLNSIAKKHHDQKPIPGVRFYNEPTLAVRAR